jgi:ATP-dependent helicase/nuclease subunit A
MPALPDWLRRTVAAEPRPPRPLAPSLLGDEAASEPPARHGQAGSGAARRGVLLHRLLERLPEVPADARPSAAATWLARSAADLGPDERDEIAAATIAILADPQWHDLFEPGSLAEVPIAATVAGQVIAGTVDRLVIGEDVIRIIDFKTSRAPPVRVEDVPLAYVRQMAAYAAALAAIHADRRIEAALLYTQAPRLLVLPPALLAAHKPGSPGPQESFAG